MIENFKIGGNRMSTDNFETRILKQTDLYRILPFQRTKVQQLIKAGALPVVKVGKDYITTWEQLEKWVDEHIGEDIYY